MGRFRVGATTCRARHRSSRTQPVATSLSDNIRTNWPNWYRWRRSANSSAPTLAIVPSGKTRNAKVRLPSHAHLPKVSSVSRTTDTSPSTVVTVRRSWESTFNAKSGLQFPPRSRHLHFLPLKSQWSPPHIASPHSVQLAHEAQSPVGAGPCATAPVGNIEPASKQTDAANRNLVILAIFSSSVCVPSKRLSTWTLVIYLVPPRDSVPRPLWLARSGEARRSSVSSPRRLWFSRTTCSKQNTWRKTVANMVDSFLFRASFSRPALVCQPCAR